MKANILIVEDEGPILELLALNISQAGYNPLRAISAEHAEKLINEALPDIILLDWMLPGMSGIDFAKKLRSNALTKTIPIIMLTARSDELDKVKGLEIGADDYITKPFSPRELNARIKAVLRRKAPELTEDILKINGLELNPVSHRVTGNNKPLEMGPTEFRLLHFFMSNPERVYSRSQLLDKVWGSWLERAGPRKAGLVSTLCWCGGLLLSAFGIYTHQLWMMWLGSGVIGGIGLGLGYISPVSTLIKWFPDKRGMATGMAIMGFGGGAMIGSPLATMLMTKFSTNINGMTQPGIWQTFVVLAIIYTIFMISGSLGYRVPPSGWKPAGWNPPNNKNNNMSSVNHVRLNKAHQTPQCWFLWIVLCMNVSAGIGIIGAAAPMLQETFGGALIGHADLGFADLKKDESLLALAAAVGAGFVGLISLFNIFGRFFWASISDKLGRKLTYIVFFTLGILMYVTASYMTGSKSLALFAACFCIIASMYGGGFATIPAYLADMFGTQFVGAIHGRILTAWSTAGILGPVIVNYMHDMRAIFSFYIS